MLGKSELNNLKKKFVEYFGDGGRVFFAPSRINIIGEHIDYNGGKVLPAAIDIGTYAIAKPNSINKLRLKSLNMEYEDEIELSDLEYDENRNWINYVVGMFKFIKEAGYEIGGCDILIYGNIPNGAGLSSSASLEILIAKIVSVFFNKDKIPNIEMAKLGKHVENEYIGVNSGIMDQFAITMGKDNKAIYLDTNTLDYEYIDMDLKDYSFVILNTNKRRELKDSKYNIRRKECEEGLEILKKYEDINNLCDFLPDQRFYKALDKIKDENIKNRVLHVVTENQRVKLMIMAMENNDLIQMGRLLDSSHKSLKEKYEVTGFELDSIVEAARENENTLGARMTGAGFGGCAIALIKTSGFEDFKSEVSKKYFERTDIECEIFLSKIDDGPREVVL